MLSKEQFNEQCVGKIICGDALTVLKTLPDEVFNCCITSPPYWGLRDYEIEGQIGLEKTPEEYIYKLLMIFKEVKRVLRKDGTLWLNISDTYYGGGWRSSKFPEGSKQATNKGALRCEFIPKQPPHPVIKSKDLCLIPQNLVISLQFDGWYIRSDIIWAKSNPMPESCTDRPTRSYEHLFLLSKSPDYYYDQIFEPLAQNSDMAYRRSLRVGRKYGVKRPYADNQPLTYGKSPTQTNGVKNRRDVWTINNKNSGCEHIATFPPELIEPCIIAGCPEGGIVLDCFMGSGTVAKVALANRRNFTGIELNPKYIQDIANFRVKEFETGVPAKQLKKGQLALYE